MCLQYRVLQFLTGTRRTGSDIYSTAPLCCPPGPVYTPHRYNHPSSLPPSLWCPHSLRDTSWYTGRSQCRTLEQRKEILIFLDTLLTTQWLPFDVSESIIILGLVVWRLADAVELGVLLALPGACRRDHLLLLGLGWRHGLPLLLPFPLVCRGDGRSEMVLRGDAVRVCQSVLLLVVDGSNGGSLGCLLGCGLSPLLLPPHPQQVPL